MKVSEIIQIIYSGFEHSGDVEFRMPIINGEPAPGLIICDDGDGIHMRFAGREELDYAAMQASRRGFQVIKGGASDAL